MTVSRFSVGAAVRTFVSRNTRAAVVEEVPPLILTQSPFCEMFAARVILAVVVDDPEAVPEMDPFAFNDPDTELDPLAVPLIFDVCCCRSPETVDPTSGSTE